MLKALSLSYDSISMSLMSIKSSLTCLMVTDLELRHSEKWIFWDLSQFSATSEYVVILLYTM